MTRARRQLLSRLAAGLAWLAALAFVLQPMTAAAMAAPHSQTVKIQLCSSHDSGQTLTVEIPAPPSKASDCHECPACVIAPALTAPPVLGVERAEFSAYAAVFAPRFERVLPPATAPPRPFGQGPPAFRHA